MDPDQGMLLILQFQTMLGTYVYLQLDIIVGSMKLEDQFEWDLDNVNTSPEQPAEVYGADLSLTGEYMEVTQQS